MFHIPECQSPYLHTHEYQLIGITKEMMKNVCIGLVHSLQGEMVKVGQKRMPNDEVDWYVVG